MEKLILALGLDVRILIAQFVSFGILLFVLYKMGYKPMLKFLDERSKKIEKGVKDAEEAHKKIIELAEVEKETIKEAKKQALVIIEEARDKGETRRAEIIKKAKEEIGQIINVEKEKMRFEKAETLKQAKKEVASLVVAGLEKILEEKIDNKKDKELIKKIVKGLK